LSHARAGARSRDGQDQNIRFAADTDPPLRIVDKPIGNVFA